MGENKNIKELDAFAKKYIKEIDKEKVSLDFTASLMDKIVDLKIEAPIKTTPLISKKVWFAISAIFAGIVFLSYQSSGKKIGVSKLDFSFLDKLNFTNIFNNISISNTTLYAFLFFGLMIAVQFIYLKKYFEKRFD